MADIPQIRKVMTSMPITIEGSTTIHQAKNIMYEKEIRHLPVVEGGALIGVISDRDLKLAQAVADNSDFDTKALVKDYCVRDVYTASPETSLLTVLQNLSDRHIGSVIVLDQDRVVGIFTLNDACRQFAKYLSV